MDPDVAHKLESFRKSVNDAAEHIVFSVFPSKILELHQLITSFSSPESQFHLSHAPGSTDVTVYPPPETGHADVDELQAKKRRRTAEGSVNGALEHSTSPKYIESVHANKHLVKLHEVLKSECEQLADSCDQVKLWINLTMPRIEDGDNFGVQVQEEALSELLRSQESAYNLRDRIRLDHLARAKICSKLIKYPNIEDYPLALKAHDDKHFYFARQNLLDIRNVYAVLTDVLHKNIKKIRVPKANNGVGLY